MTIVEIIQFLVATRRVLDILIESQVRRAAAEDLEKLLKIQAAVDDLSKARSSEEKANGIEALSLSVNGPRRPSV